MASGTEVRRNYFTLPQRHADQTPIEEAGLSTAVADHGQAGLLCGRPPPERAEDRAPLAQGAEQPGGEFPSTAALTGTRDAGLSAARKSAAVRQCALRRA